MAAISVFGLGYVGCVSAACFARNGHQVIGVDVSQDKVDMVNAGRSTIVEEGIADLVREAAAVFSRAALGPEGQEGTGAFLQKRKPSWAVS